jgi:hypothetical protein
MEKRTQTSKHEPPKAPEIDRRVRLARTQMIGMPIIALVPLLAMLGMFGERWNSEQASGTRLSATVEYPTRFRAKLGKPLTVHVENRSATAIDSVELEIDSSYVEQFAVTNFVPSPHDAHVVALGSIPPGEARRVRIELEGTRSGRHRGRVVVRAPGDSVSFALTTIVFP